MKFQFSVVVAVLQAVVVNLAEGRGADLRSAGRDAKGRMDEGRQLTP